MRKKDIAARSIFGAYSPFRFVADRLRTDRLSILAYHRIDALPGDDYPFQEETVSSTPEMFRRQLQFLKKYCFVTNFFGLYEYLEAGEPLPRNTVIITFDDGYRDNFDIAAPILAEFGLTAVMYVVTDCIDSGKPFWFDRLSYDVMRMPETQLSLLNGKFSIDISDGRRKIARRAIGDLVRTLDDNTRLEVLDDLSQQAGTTDAMATTDRMVMNWDEVAELATHGFEIGSHTVTHPFLSRLSHDEIIFELRHSKERIAECARTAVVSLSYPTGGKDFYDNRVLQQAEQCGYKFAVSYEHDSAAFNRKLRYELPRIHVESDVSLALFKANILMPNVFVSRALATIQS